MALAEAITHTSPKVKTENKVSDEHDLSGDSIGQGSDHQDAAMMTAMLDAPSGTHS